MIPGMQMPQGMIPPGMTFAGARGGVPPKSFQQTLQDMIRMATGQHEGAPDEESRATMLNAAAQLAKMLAKHEKDRDQAMGMSAQHRTLRRGG